MSAGRELFRRKPIVAPTRSSGGLTRGIGTFQLAMFGVGATVGTGVFFVMHEAVPLAGPAVLLVVRARRDHRGALRRLLRRTGIRGAGVGLDVLLRVRDARRDRGDGRRRVPDARVRRLDGRGRLGVERLPQPPDGEPVRLDAPGGAQRRSARGRDHQPSRRRARRPLRAAAHPRHARVRDRQHDHGPHQARGARDVRRRSRSRRSPSTTSRTSPRTASRA